MTASMPSWRLCTTRRTGGRPGREFTRKPPSRRGSQPVKIVEKRVEVPVYMTALGPDPDKPRMVGKCQQFSPQGEHAETQTVRDLEEASTQTELLVEPVSTLRTDELSRRVVKTAMCDLLRQKLKEKATDRIRRVMRCVW
ncbi:hypothetical protein J8273_8428 [Carpediemonas membranifera]|uniref:Uncharacterized protein n=1 Tax=Carpediemonas membranifera TaxID=201153 RepID=A0A8J6DXA4_9EUKA|nr:hypothetical protein J8273_8428 [Carpediemonas membranifera]|eukprot:KAG9389754.1 hypothetical protein J8273_8428 [Carpediemonas membranifera]